MPGFHRRLEELFRAHRYTILADPNHEHQDATLAFLTSDRILLAARRAGVTTVFLEIPRELQPAFDKFASRGVAARFHKGRLQGASRHFIETMKSVFEPSFAADSRAERLFERLADIVRLCGKHGMRAIAVDEENAEERQATRRVIGSASAKAISEFVSSHSADAVARALDEIDEQVIRMRLSQAENARIAHTIAASAEERGGHAIGIYGLMHAPALKAAFESAHGSATIVGIHLTKRDYDSNARFYAERLDPIEIARFDNLVLDSQEFLPAQSSPLPVGEG